MFEGQLSDGICSMVPREKMIAGARKLRDTYGRKPDAPFYQREFGFYSLERWENEGKLSVSRNDKMKFKEYLKDLFRYDEPGNYSLDRLGGCEAAFCPCFEEKIIENRGEHELVQDFAGRHVLYFKGRRQGFMPEYIDHPVKDIKSWEENCKWRLDPKTAERYMDIENRMLTARECAGKGMIITQYMVGGYMYLRSLIGPIDLLYKFYDDPELIHECMKTWFELSDAVIARHQQYVTIDELLFDEDICYNHGSLISPDMIREFLFPYYQQLLINVKSRQLDRNRHLYFHVATDGFVVPVIPLYMEIGMDVMSPFEVASGCDVTEIGRRFPDIVMSGGIDKRILAQGTDAIDKYLDNIMPNMKKRGGYIPTCDHGVPAEVSFENYMHYRKRCLEYA